MKKKILTSKFLPKHILPIIIALLELLLAIALFIGMLFAAGYIAYKGFISYNILISFLLLAFLLMSISFSVKKGKTLFLTISIIVIISVIFYNYRSKTNERDVIKQEKKLFTQKGPRFFEENFERNILQNWSIQKYTFPENGCDMIDSQIELNNSQLVITVVPSSKSRGKPFKGGEISSNYLFLYGKFHVKMKNQIAEGTVSSFFLMNKWQSINWEHKEIDIEFLGKDLNSVQFTVHFFEDRGRKHKFKQYTHNLEFNSSESYHDYGIIWTKDSITWLVDNKPIYTEKDILIFEPMDIRMNHWAALPYNNDSIINWMGKVNNKQLPSKVYYEYVKYYPLIPK
jgi:beta-glucanase (GH16 family)